MNRSAWIADACSYILVVLFVYAALNKLIHWRTFQGQLVYFPVLRQAVGWVAVGTITAELGITTLLLRSRSALAGLYASLILLVIFTAYLGIMVAASLHLPCSCGGIIEKLSWRQHILFNLFFIGVTGLGIHLHSPHHQ